MGILSNFAETFDAVDSIGSYRMLAAAERQQSPPRPMEGLADKLPVPHLFPAVQSCSGRKIFHAFAGEEHSVKACKFIEIFVTWRRVAHGRAAFQ